MDLSYLELGGKGQGIIMEVTRPLFLGQFHLVKWPITPNKSAGSVAIIHGYLLKEFDRLGSTITCLRLIP